MNRGLPYNPGAAKEREQALLIEARLEALLAEARDRERVWASGVCPDSGEPIHSCHRSICDCWGAEDCASCKGAR